MPLFVIVAGEASGDRLGAALMRAIASACPEASFTGVPGPLMREAGCQPLFWQEDLAVMGFVDVIKHLPLILKRRAQLLKAVKALAPAVYIGIDAPDFNLPIERKLKKQGFKTVHVNSPTVWAWRPGRLKKIAQSVDLMLLLFPFEQAIYDQALIPAVYIGHPLADQLPIEVDVGACRVSLGLQPQHPVLAILPGSRASELAYLAPTFLEVAKNAVAAIPHLQCCVPLINEASLQIFRLYWQKHAPELKLHCSVGNAHRVIQAADTVLVASGTAALEVMLCHKPMVVAYRMHALNYAIAKRLVKAPYVSLPNILSGHAWVPERLQDEATVLQLTADVIAWFNETDRYEQTRHHFLSLHHTLRQNAAEKAALAILAIASQNTSIAP